MFLTYWTLIKDQFLTSFFLLESFNFEFFKTIFKRYFCPKVFFQLSSHVLFKFTLKATFWKICCVKICIMELNNINWTIHIAANAFAHFSTHLGHRFVHQSYNFNRLQWKHIVPMNITKSCLFQYKNHDHCSLQIVRIVLKTLHCSMRMRTMTLFFVKIPFLTAAFPFEDWKKIFLGQFIAKNFKL